MSAEDKEPLPLPEPDAGIPVLRDVVTVAPTPLDVAMRRLDRDARAALAAETAFLVDELLDEYLPLLEARLRERLEQRLRDWLDSAP